MKKLVSTGATAGVVALSLVANTAAQPKSKGVYRIPYQNGTTVKVTNDHKKHKPLGRIDMSGTGGGRYKIVAAADGTIRFIVDGFSKQVDSSSGDPCTNNYVWIEHANGEWPKYSHMTKNSTRKTARLKVGQFVKAGKFLGYEGQVGCASGSHLHFEVGVPRASDPITTTGGFLRDNAGSKRNRIPRICSIPGGAFQSGKDYEARKVPGNLSPGSKEVARHGLPERDYQCFFDQARNAGYEPAWVDGFNHKGKVYFNAVFRPKSGAKWAAFHNLSGSAYQSKFDQYTKTGFRPTQIESYRKGSSARYAVICKKGSGPRVAAYHGLSPAAHQKRFDDLTKKGWRPKNISVVSVRGSRKYTGLYEKTSIGSYVSKSFVSVGDYQKFFNENQKKGRQVAYLAAYEHKGKPYFSVIWNSKTKGAYRARHNLSGSKYQTEWKSAVQSGYRTRNVTGYSSGGTIRYAAVWRK